MVDPTGDEAMVCQATPARPSPPLQKNKTKNIWGVFHWQNVSSRLVPPCLGKFPIMSQSNTLYYGKHYLTLSSFWHQKNKETGNINNSNMSQELITAGSHRRTVCFSHPQMVDHHHGVRGVNLTVSCTEQWFSTRGACIPRVCEEIAGHTWKHFHSSIFSISVQYGHVWALYSSVFAGYNSIPTMFVWKKM